VKPEDVVANGPPITLTFTSQEWRYIGFAARQMARKRLREKAKSKFDGNVDTNVVTSTLLNRAADKIMKACMEADGGQLTGVQKNEQGTH
jgi:hypothetical protein